MAVNYQKYCLCFFCFSAAYFCFPTLNLPAIFFLTFPTLFKVSATKCTKVFPLHRIVEDTPAISRSALEALLGGPTLHERSLGYGTSINSGVVVQSISVQDGVARVDFDRAIERSVGGSCRVAAIRAQIAETLKQFPEISSVVISVEGETEAALQP